MHAALQPKQAAQGHKQVRHPQPTTTSANHRRKRGETNKNLTHHNIPHQTQGFGRTRPYNALMHTRTNTISTLESQHLQTSGSTCLVPCAGGPKTREKNVTYVRKKYTGLRSLVETRTTNATSSAKSQEKRSDRHARRKCPPDKFEQLVKSSNAQVPSPRKAADPTCPKIRSRLPPPAE